MKPSKNLIIAIVVTAVVAGGGGFFGGMVYGKSQTATRGANGQFSLNGGARGANGNMPGAAAGARLRGGTGFVNGSILAKDDKSITVKNRAGGSQIIFYAPSTTIAKASSGTANDLVVGENITANGTPNADGTVTATNIQIIPADMIPTGGVRSPGSQMLINGGTLPPGTTNIPNNK